MPRAFSAQTSGFSGFSLDNSGFSFQISQKASRVQEFQGFLSGVSKSMIAATEVARHTKLNTETDCCHEFCAMVLGCGNTCDEKPAFSSQIQDFQDFCRPRVSNGMVAVPKPIGIQN